VQQVPALRHAIEGPGDYSGTSRRHSETQVGRKEVRDQHARLFTIALSTSMFFK
jgi:hypothetical protein